MRDPKERLRDILDAIARIERYASRGREAFEQDELIQVWMFHHLQIIGEAAANLGRDFYEAHPEVPWRQIVAMRNVLVHEYFGVDLRRSGRSWNAICPPSSAPSRSFWVGWREEDQTVRVAREQQAEAARLDAAIWKNLKELGYGE